MSVARTGYAQHICQRVAWTDRPWISVHSVSRPSEGPGVPGGPVPHPLAAGLIGIPPTTGEEVPDVPYCRPDPDAVGDIGAEATFEPIGPRWPIALRDLARLCVGVEDRDGTPNGGCCDPRLSYMVEDGLESGRLTGLTTVARSHCYNPRIQTIVFG